MLYGKWLAYRNPEPDTDAELNSILDDTVTALCHGAFGDVFVAQELAVMSERLQKLSRDTQNKITLMNRKIKAEKQRTAELEDAINEGSAELEQVIKRVLKKD